MARSIELALGYLAVKEPDDVTEHLFSAPQIAYLRPIRTFHEQTKDSVRKAIEEVMTQNVTVYENQVASSEKKNRACRQKSDRSNGNITKSN